MNCLNTVFLATQDFTSSMKRFSLFPISFSAMNPTIDYWEPVSRRLVLTVRMASRGVYLAFQDFTSLLCITWKLNDNYNHYRGTAELLSYLQMWSDSHIDGCSDELQGNNECCECVTFKNTHERGHKGRCTFEIAPTPDFAQTQRWESMHEWPDRSNQPRNHYVTSYVTIHVFMIA